MSRFARSLAGGLVLVGMYALPSRGLAEPAQPRRLPSSLAPVTEDPQTAARRAEAIEALKPVLGRANGWRKAELLFRLAELYLEEARAIRAQEMLAHDTAYVAWVEAGSVGSPPDLDRYLRRTTLTLRTVESLYRRTLEAAPEYRRGDEVRLALGTRLLERGATEEGRAQLRALISHYPKSMLQPRAHLLLAESDFAADRLEPARRHYTFAARWGDRETSTFALYKLAWCDLNAGEPSAGVAKLVQVVEISRAVARLSLEAEALSDLVGFYARAEDAAGATRTYRRLLGAEGSRPYLARLAQAFDAQGDWRRGVALREGLLADEVDPDLQLGLLEGLAQLQDLQRLRALVPALALASPLDETQAARLLDLAARHAQPHAKRPALEVAAAVYEAYLAVAAPSPRRAEALYFAAVVADRLGDVRAAAEGFDEVVASAHAGRLYPLALHESVLAWARTHDAAADRTTARAEAEVGLVSAARRFVEAQPEHPERFAVQLKLAALLEARGDRGALAAFREVALDGAPDLAAKAAKALIAHHAGAEAWGDVEAVATELAAKTTDPALRAELTVAADAAAYRGLQAREADAAEAEALVSVAQGFMALVDRRPEAAVADDALVSARRLFVRAGRLDLAQEAASRLAEGYPDSPHQVDNRLAYARLHEQTGDFANAARLLAQFAQAHPEHVGAKDALFDAGLYFHGLEEKAAARRTLGRFVARYPDDADAPKVGLLACKSETRPQARVRCATRLLARHPGAPAGYLAQVRLLRIKALEGARQHRAARKQMRALAAEWARLDESARADEAVRLATAYAAFHLVEPEYAAYLKKRITLRQRSLVSKLSAARKLACAPGMAGCEAPGAYYDVLRLQHGAFGVAALTRIGQVFENAARTIREAPVPRNLDEAQAEVYRAQIESLVLPLEARADEAFETAVAEARRLGVYDEWALAAETALRERRGAPPAVQPRLLRPAGDMAVVGTATRAHP